MIIKNTSKLFGANFSLTWKNVLCELASIFVIILLNLICCIPLIQVFANNGIFQDISNFIFGLPSHSFQASFINFANLMDNCGQVISANISTLGFSLICVIIFNVLYFGIFNTLKLMGTMEVLRAQMTSASKFGYVGACIQRFSDAFTIGLIRFITFIPFIAIYIGIYYYIYALITIGGFAYSIAPFCAIIAFVIVSAFQLNVFSCWLPNVIMQKFLPSKSLFSSIELSLNTCFWKNYLRSILVMLVVIVVNYFLARFTACISLIVTIPATIVLLSSFRMITFFDHSGLRYYLNSQLIFTSKKIELLDTPEKVKYLI